MNWPDEIRRMARRALITLAGIAAVARGKAIGRSAGYVRTSIHEAGHVVVAILAGLTVVDVAVYGVPEASTKNGMQATSGVTRISFAEALPARDVDESASSAAGHALAQFAKEYGRGDTRRFRPSWFEGTDSIEVARLVFMMCWLAAPAGQPASWREMRQVIASLRSAVWRITGVSWPAIDRISRCILDEAAMELPGPTAAAIASELLDLGAAQSLFECEVDLIGRAVARIVTDDKKFSALLPEEGRAA